MEADVLNSLKTRSAYLPGGRDHDGHLMIVIHVPYEIQPWTKRHLELSINYILSAISEETINSGIIAIIDAQKCGWRLARAHIRHVSQLLESKLDKMIVIRPDAFWDKQRVENCAKTYKKGEPIIIAKSRLSKYFEPSQLPDELGGTFTYNHDQWIQNRVKIEEFKKCNDKALNDLENLHIILLDNKSIRANETEQMLKSCSTINVDVQHFVRLVMENGNNLINHINDLQNSKSPISHDLIDSKELIKTMLNEIEKKETQIASAWTELEKSIIDVRELAALEEGVTYVTNWILGTADNMLNSQLKVGYDVQTSEKLRLEHELQEFQCWKTYGYYAELLYKIDHFPILKDSFAHKDLTSQRDFMDFVCRSFATRLERRRNILITSVRFYRLVSEYFDRTSEVFESLIMGDKVDDFELAKSKLQKLKDSQQSLDNVEKELIREGEKLSDMLSMPVKDALGRDISIDYSDDIANIRDILDATIARRNIFVDSVELQKLTLEQITHIHTYENDAIMAIKWMDDLYNVMIKSHTHVGCNIYEIQTQKDEHQIFQETAKGTFNYGCQLLNASLALRQSCKLSSEKNLEMTERLQSTWKKLQQISQEQMTRLRVSAVFHRSVEEHCVKLKDLKNSVLAVVNIEDAERKKNRLRKYLASREKLLVEVGRMVRLGRLLKTRLKEPFVLDDRPEVMSNEENLLTKFDNTIACEAIVEKLSDVSRVAESLDNVLRGTQTSLDAVDSNNNLTATATTTGSPERKTSSNNNSDDWNSSMKSSTEDDSFITASDCTCTPQSRSSSYHTASECRASPWWESPERSSLDPDSSDVDPEVPTMRLLSGVISSANVSFDESEHSFLSASLTDNSEDNGENEKQLLKLNHIIDSSSSDKSISTISSEIKITPTINSSQQTDEIAAKVRANDEFKINEVQQPPTGLSFYYQNIITKHTVKGCL